MAEKEFAKRCYEVGDLHASGKTEDAERKLAAIWRDYPGSEQAFALLVSGCDHMKSGQLDLAIDQLTGAIANRYGHPLAVFYRGLCWYFKLKAAANDAAMRMWNEGSAAVIDSWPRQLDTLLSAAIKDVHAYLDSKPPKGFRIRAQRLLDAMWALAPSDLGARVDV